MSLINEALKRARVEAARRDAAEKGVPESALPVYVPQRRRAWVAPVLGFAGGLLAVAIAVGVYWMIARDPSPEASRQATSPLAADPAPSSTTVSDVGVAAESPRVPLAAESPSGSVEPTTGDSTPPTPPRVAEVVAAEPSTGGAAPSIEPQTVSVAAPQPTAGEAGHRRQAPAGSSAPPPSRPPTPQPAPPIESPEPVSATAAGEPRPSVRDRPAAAAPRQGSQAAQAPSSYLREVPLSGGGKIKLDFIVWSETRPFAQINGELVNPGQVKEDFILHRVERDRIELEIDGGSRVWVRVK